MGITQTESIGKNLFKSFKSNSFNSARDRTELLQVYRDWLTVKKPIYAKYNNVINMLFMAILIPFDFIFFDNSLLFTRFRVLLIVLFGLNIMLLYINQKHSKILKKDQLNLILLAPGLLFNFLYIFFLYLVSEDLYTVVLIANLAVVLFTTLFLRRFWKEQYLLNIFSIILLLFVGIIKPQISGGCILIIVCHVGAFMTVFFFRREFVASMYSVIHFNK